MTTTEFHWIADGGVSSAQGIKAAGVHAGFRANPHRLDVALIEADELCPVAATFTQNIFCAAPVIVCKEHLDNQGYGVARALVVNSGTANAATGTTGIENAQATCDIVADVIGCAPEDVLVASTGVIGVHLNTDPFKESLPILREKLGSEGSGSDAAHAIMTTDTVAKECAVSWQSADPNFEGVTFTVGGMSKGSGMIMPNMATMIGVLSTDVPLSAEDAHTALVAAVNQSFNRVTVDSDTSTNDCCFLFATGKAAAVGEGSGATGSPAAKRVMPGSTAWNEFNQALIMVTQDLARKMAKDGEGATKLITVNVVGAASEEEADLAARTVANSPLVKTAMYGNDANWGRVAAALGRSGAHFKSEDVDIDILGLPVLRAGLPVEFSEEEALERFKEPEITIWADLGAGDASATIWTCDFSHDYVSINGDYRS